MSIEQAHEWIAEAEHVLITSGAGLSGAAGYDYSDEVRFAEVFPALTRTGFRNRLEFINPRLRDEFLWGFWALHLRDIRFDPRPNALYTELRARVAHADTFSYTSNVDQLFARNGFDPERIATPQGDYGSYQCFTPCTREVWPTELLIQDLIPLIDPHTGALPTEAVPRCPRCGGRTFLNVNIGANYVIDPYLPGVERLNAWLPGAARVVVLEIGAGFNTPGVVRWPGERIVAQVPGSHLIRVNPTAADIPDDIADRSVGLAVGVDEFLRAGEPTG